MAVLLEQDQEQPVQAHLDELTWRTTVLFTAVAVLTLAWSTVVNDVLHLALISLQPCPGDCLNVYDPAQWSAVRWLTSLLLALLSALPLVAFHVLQFAKPGLLPSEYTALRRWMLVSILTLVCLSVVLMTHVLPALYDMGYQQHREAGLAAQYSAIDMLLVAAYCVWSLMVIAATWTGLVVMGRLGVLNQSTADVWRLRLYGVGTLLLLLSLPDHAQPVLLPLLATYWTTSELVGQRWLFQQAVASGHAQVRLDEDGRRQRIAILDCACDGANVHHGHATIPGCSTVSVNALCTSSTDRTTSIEHLVQARITDAVITGCDAGPCPNVYKENMLRLGVRLHGLNTMALQNHRVATPNPSLDVLWAFQTLPSLFPAGARERNIVDLIDQGSYVEKKMVELDPSSLNRWPTEYLEIDALVHG